MSETLVTQEDTSFKAFEEKLSLLITFSFKAIPLFTSSQGENKAETTLPTALGIIKNNPAPNTDSTAKAKIKSLSPEEKDIIIFDNINATAVPIFPVDEKSPAISPPKPKPPHKKLSESELKENTTPVEMPPIVPPATPPNLAQRSTTTTANALPKENSPMPSPPSASNRMQPDITMQESSC